MLDNSIGESGALPVYYTKRKCRDTSLGGNDAINCYYQFNELDDPSHPFLHTDFGDSSMGRTHSEELDDLQQIMYLTFGVPEFNSISGFFSDAIVGDLAKLMNTGETWDVAKISRLIGEGVGTLLRLPVLPLAWLNRKLGGLSRTKITKYYDFKSTMPLYYRFVNSIIQHLAVNMGMSRDGYLLNPNMGVTNDGATIGMGASQQTGSKTSVATHNELYAQTGAAGNVEGLPDIFQRAGFDIYRILCKKYMYMNNEKQGDLKTSDWTLIEELKQNPPVSVMTESATNAYSNADGVASGVIAAIKTYANSFFTQFTGSLYDAQLYIGFKIEKGTDSSESISNSTGESSVAQSLNSKLQAARDFKFSTMAGNIGDGALANTLETVMGAVGNFGKGLMQSVQLDTLAETLSGNSIIDIPEVWTGSTFSKSYSFTLSLRSPYGDPVSIMSSIYIPLACILAGSLPRAVGASAYTSPFLCRAYSKGMFAIPLGIIESVSIKRGSDQHGWNHQRLPTSVDVSFQIKDLSPAMYMALADDNFMDVFGSNSSFQEYLLTLSGIGTGERLLYLQNLRKKAEILLSIASTTKFSPFYLGLEAGDTYVGRMLSAVVPSTRVLNS